MRLRTCVWTLTLAAAATASANVWHVMTTGDDAQDGSTWATAKLTITAALLIAQAGDQIWVAQGTYIDNILLTEGVELYGGFAGTETSLSQRRPFPRTVPDPDETILNALLSDHVVELPTGATAATKIDGFTLYNGSSYNGGGVYCRASSPTIVNNTIVGNRAVNAGGGIYCSDRASPTISNNVIADNYAHLGGGVYFGTGIAEAKQNTIIGNCGFDGAGIYCATFSSVTIFFNTIANNMAENNGGGVYCSGYWATVWMNDIISNHARSGAGVCCIVPAIIASNYIGENKATGYGGGVYCSATALSVSNNLIAGNRADVYGGGIYSPSSSDISNNTIIRNNGGYGGGIACFSSPTIANNVVAYNSSGIYTSGGTPALWNNCVYNPDGFDYFGVTAGSRDIPRGPIFVRDPTCGEDGEWGTRDDEVGDLRLQSGSPCIDAGDNAFVLQGLVTDIRERPRFRDDQFTIDCPWAEGTCGEPPIVDIGAYEFQTVVGDSNRDENVDFVDLAAFLACSSGPAIPYTGNCGWSDFDEDNDVDSVDFAVFQRCYGDAVHTLSAECTP